MSGPGIYGHDKQFGAHQAVASLNAFPVNSTQTLYALVVPTGFGKIRIEKIQFVATAALNDADGTMLVTVTARDASEGADDVLVNAASVEGVVAHALTDLTLEADGTERIFTLEEGDSVRVAFVNNSAAIDTNGVVACIIYYHSIPRETAGDDIKRAEFYTKAA